MSSRRLPIGRGWAGKSKPRPSFDPAAGAVCKYRSAPLPMLTYRTYAALRFSRTGIFDSPQRPALRMALRLVEGRIRDIAQGNEVTALCPRPSGERVAQPGASATWRSLAEGRRLLGSSRESEPLTLPFGSTSPLRGEVIKACIGDEASRSAALRGPEGLACRLGRPSDPCACPGAGRPCRGRRCGRGAGASARPSAHR